jgi:hypothetical protein
LIDFHDAPGFHLLKFSETTEDEKFDGKPGLLVFSCSKLTLVKRSDA